ncbi:L,D-transpeptidase catalytic domain [Halopseudomonas litoralis]|uniref:L,D-transpeptidase catalytic domain n=1 Tax=Halopseudomonas litoralis TaxID=797277 RepID=A0A1H1RTR2_9GAMM|nr:L,D-transpeptidase [Halopseudomonas litoralis]SDS39121.1 L,D-transpeptidase catalytic domain [Halopseudomonas litoralis]
MRLDLIHISLEQQMLTGFNAGRLLCSYPVSTAKNGAGELNGSGCTPRGRHRVRARIGEGQPLGAVFIGRRPTGEVWSSELAEAQPQRDWILTRILWLCGEEVGVNRGADSDSQRRYIYLHGTGDDQLMGTPLSHGCVRLRNPDMLALFDMTPAGCPVIIE